MVTKGFPETTPQNVDIYKAAYMVSKNLPGTGIWSLQDFYSIQFTFVNIFASWNDLGKPFETI